MWRMPQMFETCRKKCLTHKLSECERKRRLREATMTPTATGMEWGFSSFNRIELPHNRCPSPSPVTCKKRLWSNDTRTEGLDHQTRQTRKYEEILEEKSWRRIWPGLKGECYFNRWDLFWLRDPEVNHTEERHSFERKPLLWCGIQNLDLSLTDNLMMNQNILFVKKQSLITATPDSIHDKNK